MKPVQGVIVKITGILPLFFRDHIGGQVYVPVFLSQIAGLSLPVVIKGRKKETNIPVFVDGAVDIGGLKGTDACGKSDDPLLVDPDTALGPGVLCQAEMDLILCRIVAHDHAYIRLKDHRHLHISLQGQQGEGASVQDGVLDRCDIIISGPAFRAVIGAGRGIPEAFDNVAAAVGLPVLEIFALRNIGKICPVIVPGHASLSIDKFLISFGSPADRIDRFRRRSPLCRKDNGSREKKGGAQGQGQPCRDDP